jgi:hypothetical protein
LCAADVRVVECEGIAAARRLPAEAVLGESALAALLGEVEVDVVEALALVAWVSRRSHRMHLLCSLIIPSMAC